MTSTIRFSQPTDLPKAGLLVAVSQHRTTKRDLSAPRFARIAALTPPQLLKLNDLDNAEIIRASRANPWTIPEQAQPVRDRYAAPFALQLLFHV